MSKMSFIDKIEVKSPCNESWEEMEGNDVVRFCSHCSKSVNNLSAVTRRQAEKLVRKSGGKICVKYRTEPNTGLPVFARKINRLAARTGIAAGVLGASLLIADGAYAQGDPASVEVVRPEKTPNTDGAAGKLSGFVTDPNGAVIPFAFVSITNKETSEYRTAVPNSEGHYEFAEIPAGTYVVKFEAGGFETKELPSVYVNEAAEIRRDAQLDLPQVSEVVQVGGKEPAESFVGVIVGDIGVVESRNALVQAAMKGDLEEVKARVMMRARVNSRDKAYDGITALHAAVEIGSVEIAQYLLSRGAKINIRDHQKRTPLMMLDEDASPEMFQLLVTYGAKVGLVDKERNTVLHHFAAYDEQSEMIRALVNYGVDVNAMNKEGKTALMIAAENESASNIEALVQSGADPNLAGRDGKTAWMLTDDEDTRSVLETFGASAVHN